MKRIAVALVYLLLFTSVCAFAQEQRNSVYERVSDSAFAFYFDSQYFLTDKNCEFFSIKRLSNYDTVLKTFEGPFSDYDYDGNLILSGSYSKGKKEGTFRAFYPDGFLKWQAVFSDNEPVGSWFYYYPDGRPQAIFKIEGNRAHILSTWSEKGKVLIKDGSGRFELTDPQFGFNEKGYASIIYSGRVKNGLPDGKWIISYGYERGEREIKTVEEYENGELKSRKTPEIQFTPAEPYLNAENFLSKNCTIDEYYNYTVYLSSYLTEQCGARADDERVDTLLRFTVDVDAQGRSSKVVLLEASKYDGFNEVILDVIKSVPFWIPSQKDGKAIRDTLTVDMDIKTDSKDRIYFSNAKIGRKNGT